MAAEKVEIVAGGRRFGGWEKVSIAASLKKAVRTFQVDTTELPGEWNFPPGTPVQVLAGGDLLVDGYINRYHTQGDQKTHRVMISGRGKGQDFVDCSAKHPTGNAKDKTPVEFAREFDHYGVGINAKIPLDKVPYQQIRQGETCFECLERSLRSQGATLMGEADGSISATNAKAATRAGGSLTEGHNILRWSLSLDDQDRFQEYTVKGQNRHGTGADSLRIKEEERDSGVRRYRNRIIVNETDTDKGRAKKRAKHQKNRAAGESKKSGITVVGWRDAGGALWTPNTIVFINGPRLLHLDQDMLIEAVTFEQDSQHGTTARIEIVDPRAYQGQGHDGKGSDKAWNDSWAEDGKEDR